MNTFKGPCEQAAYDFPCGLVTVSSLCHHSVDIFIFNLPTLLKLVTFTKKKENGVTFSNSCYSLTKSKDLKYVDLEGCFKNGQKLSKISKKKST